MKVHKSNRVLWDVWSSNASRSPNREVIVHYSEGVAAHRWTWEGLLERSARLADLLREDDVARGDVCAILMRHRIDFYPLYLAVAAIGAIPSVLAYPNPRLHPEKFRDGLRGMSRVSGLDWILTEGELQDVVMPIVQERGSTVRGILFPLEDVPAIRRSSPARGRLSDVAPSPDDPCLLQHSSGTTGLQKGVMLSHRAVLTHLEIYGKNIGISPDDRIVSWLPLYHDMGLIAAFHLALASNVPTVMIDPFEWVSSPELFLQIAALEHATLAWLPNFSYNLMASRIRDEDLAGIRLDSLRLLVNCSEPVRAETHDGFAARFERFGLDRNVLGASYAMAEATFAVTQTMPGTEARRLNASRESLANGSFVPPERDEPVRTCVSSGRPITGCALRIVDENDKSVPDGVVGEVLIRSQSLFSGYRNDPQTTAGCFRDDWYATGDYGFQLAGEIFVVGRKKDIIIVAGKNIYPEDVESVLHQVEGLIPGRVVAFGLPDPASGTERVCVVAETAHEEPDMRARIREAIVIRSMQIDVTVAQVVLVEPRWLIKSSAGKPSRSANKRRVEALLTDTRPK